jgi:hypothetical protein
MLWRSKALALISCALLAGCCCVGCGPKQEEAAPPAPATNNTQYPPGYVEQRTARERPMPMNTQTGK